MQLTVSNKQVVAESPDPRSSPSEAKESVQPGVEPSENRWSKMFRALRHRNYRLFWTGQLVSLTGTWMQSVAQGWLVYSLTKSDPIFGSALWLGIVSFCFSFPVLLFSLVGGVVADRVDRRKFLLLMQVASLAQAFVYSILAVTGAIEVWHIPILAFFLGTIHAFDTPTRQAIVLQLVGREDLMNAVALNSSVFNSTRIVGPGIAGLLLGAFVGWLHQSEGMPEESATKLATAICFFLNALTYLAPIVSLSLIKITAPPVKKQTDSIWHSLHEGLTYVRQNPAIFGVLSLVGVSSIFGFSYLTLLPLFAGKVLNAGAPGYGLLMAGAGVGALSAALFLASLGNYQRKGYLLTVGNFIFPVALIFFSVSPFFWLSWLCLVGVGYGLITQNALANTLIQSNVPDHLRGRILSLYTLMLLGMQPIGGLQIGSAARLLGPQEALAISASISILFGLYALWKWPQVRHLR
jgi:MFS family permease